MRRITVSLLCLVMHLLQEEITTIFASESEALQELIKPRQVEFHSLNFHTTLCWLPGRAGGARDTRYFVQYKVYGQSTWQNKEDCWGIQSHFCDLTNETSNIQEPYYGRVKAASAGVYSDWNLSCRFTPWQERILKAEDYTRYFQQCSELLEGSYMRWKKMEKTFVVRKREKKAESCVTSNLLMFMYFSDLSRQEQPCAKPMIGPPLVNVVRRKKSIILKLQAPRSPYKRKTGSSIPMTNYYDLLYQVFLINNFLDEKHSTLVYEGADKVIAIEDLRPGASYCIRARSYVPVLSRSSAYSRRQCTVLL